MERVKSTLDIGTLTGPLLVFGGSYSNLQALEKMQVIADDLGIPASNIIHTGDVVGYCAQPEEVVQAVRDWGIHVIAGNVEIQLREGQTDCGCEFSEGSRCDIFSLQWFPYAQDRLSQASIKWMDGLPDFIRFEYAGRKGLVVHGSWFKTAEYIFESTPWEVKQRNFDGAGADLVLAGHCGLPFVDEGPGRDGVWLNPGVIGMPANDGTTRVWYMVLRDGVDASSTAEMDPSMDSNARLQYAHHTFEYDFGKAASLMEGEPLPKAYAHTLRTGVWDNCEILPPSETEAAGIRIEMVKLTN